MKMIILLRQARDKHRESTQKRLPFYCISPPVPQHQTTTQLFGQRRTRVSGGRGAQRPTRSHHRQHHRHRSRQPHLRAVRQTVFSPTFILKLIVLPRQARDKQRVKHSKTGGRICKCRFHAHESGGSRAEPSDGVLPDCDWRPREGCGCDIWRLRWWLALGK
jgi:hypothetical protein